MSKLNKKILLKIFYYIMWIVALVGIVIGGITISLSYLFIAFLKLIPGIDHILYNCAQIFCLFLLFMVGISFIVSPIGGILAIRNMIKETQVTNTHKILMISLPVLTIFWGIYYFLLSHLD